MNIDNLMMVMILGGIVFCSAYFRSQFMAGFRLQIKLLAKSRAHRN